MSRNLLYFSVFYNTDYILLLQEVCRSIDRCGGVDANTDILILTHPTYQSEIENAAKESNLAVQFFFIEFNSLFHSAMARLFLYEWAPIWNYDKILYLETDILINGVLSRMFELPIEYGKLYTREEGTIGNPFWGGDLFDFSTWDREMPGFTSGVLLFRNTTEIQDLFRSVIEHIHNDCFIKKTRVPDCLEQPYLIYNAYMQNKYDTQLLKEYVVNNAEGPENKIIYHFPGGPGGFVSKYTKMLEFLKKLIA
jgi:lipopolysaccharide biosynthesis glycosyltransferase